MNCEFCGSSKVKFFERKSNLALCEDCAGECLIWNDDVVGYVYLEENKLFYTDDELTDLEVFEKE